MPSIVHFEIPADDLERAKKFYTNLFGWKIEKFQAEGNCEGSKENCSGMEYLMISTTNEKGEAAVEGGMMQRQNPQQPITNYIDVPSVDEYTAKIEKLGGRMIVPKTAVPAFGHFAVFFDTENNVFGVWEADSNAK